MLEDAARRVAGRGDYSGAVATLTRAAEPEPGSRGAQSQAGPAAYIGAEALGEMRSTSQLLEGTRQASPDVGELLHYASAAAFVMLNGDGHIDTAHRLLAGAIEGRAHRWDAGDTALINALWTLALLCFCGGRRELWDPFYAALARLSPGPPPDLALTIDMFADPARTGIRRAAPARGRAEGPCTARPTRIRSRTSRRPRSTLTVSRMSASRCGGPCSADARAAWGENTSWP